MNVREIILKVSAYNKQIEEQLEDFTTGCYTLKETSAGKYQVQKTTLLNKIYLQGYILDSKLCKQFKANNITNYSLTNLRDYITKNYNNLDTDYTSYYQALSLYEKANNLEELIDDKIELEIDLLSNYEKDIEKLKYQELKKEQLVAFYKEIKDKLVKKLTNNIMAIQTKNSILIILNDVFEFFWSGYPTIIQS